MGHRETDDSATFTGARAVPVFDAIVVGTGFGGAITACRLVQAGFHVCILERGRRYGPQDFPDLPRPRPEADVRLTSLGTEAPDLGRWFWQRDQGLWDVRNLGGVQTFQAAGWGGGSLLYCGVHLQAPPEVLSSWELSGPDAAQHPDVGPDEGPLERWYDLASYMLQLQRIDDSGQVPTKTKALDAAARAIGRTPFHPPVAINFDSVADDWPGAGIQKCKQCAACSSGCTHEAKNSLDFNYLHIAETAGPTEVRTLAEAVRVERPDDQGPWTVVYRDHLAQGTEREVRARHVFLCMGSVHTTEFLLRHAAAGALSLSPMLGMGYQPNADSLKMVYDADKRTRPSWGPTISTAVVMDTTGGKVGGDDGEWIMIQDGGYDRAFQPVFSVMQGSGFVGGNRHGDAAYGQPDPELGGLDPARPSGWAKVDDDGIVARGKDPAPADYRDGDEPPDPAPRPPQHRDVQRDTIGKMVNTVLGDGEVWDWLPRALHWDHGAVAAAMRDDLRLTYEALWKFDVLNLVARSVQSSVDATIEKMSEGLVGRLFSGLTRKLIARNMPHPSRITDMTGEHLWNILRDKSPLELLGPVMRWSGKFDAPDLRSPIRNLNPSEPRDLIPSRIELGDPDHTLMLLCMGRDGGSWDLQVEARDNGSSTDQPEHWKLVTVEPNGRESFRRRRVYEAQTRLARDIAASLGGELRDNPGWAFLRTPLTVHSQGGCRIGKDRNDGVCDEFGRVYDGAREEADEPIEGLYVLDGSLHPSAVGVNPSHTIAALTERGIEQIIRTDLGKPDFVAPEMVRAREWAGAGGPWDVQGATTVEPRAQPVGLRFRERLIGFVGEPQPAASFGEQIEQSLCLEGEGLGRGPEGRSLDFRLQVHIPSVERFLVDPRALGTITGEVDFQGSTHAVAGTIRVLQRDSDVGEGSYHMDYELHFCVHGREATLRGRKFIHDDPGPDAWNDTTALFVHLTIGDEVRPGVIRMSLTYFLTEFMPGMHITGTRDPAQVAWTMGRFLEFFTSGLRETYASWLPRLELPR